MRTIRTSQFGKTLIRLVEAKGLFTTVTINGGKICSTLNGPDGEALWREAVSLVGQSAPGFWGYADAKARFLTIFRDGFFDSDYLSSERAYKDAAASFIAAHIPIEVAAHASPEVCELANKAFAKTNMATPIEKTRVQALLRSSDGPHYLNAAAELATGSAGVALSTMDKLMRKHGQPSWPCATYFPFFWRSNAAMFLKPQITKDFAERVGHSFLHDYDARLNGDTYASLLDLATQCEGKIEEMKPRDRIDVQSFIWVVGAYTDADIPQREQ